MDLIHRDVELEDGEVKNVYNFPKPQLNCRCSQLL